MPATLVDVARHAGVSTATASRVISGSDYRVSEKIRERVREAARELNYVPNALAQGLVGAKTATVGVLVHDLVSPYFAEMVGGMQRVAFQAGKLVMVCSSYRDPERELQYLRMLHAQRVEAVIMAGSGLDDLDYAQKLSAQVQTFLADQRRVVFISRHHVPGDAVLPLNFAGAQSLGRALVEMGHRHIGVIAGPTKLTTVRDRLEAFRLTFQEAGIPLPQERVIPSDFTRDGGAMAAVELMRRCPELTAIVALNDLMAVGALAAFREMGISVPGQVSVASFGDSYLARDVTPTLSTIGIPLAELGERAMRLALQPAQAELRVEHVPLQLVLRASTAPPRQA
ncbi:MAG TPA: LacI family DNA-binding transcriptional regulator [Symbiobacteriaceae bacterium]|nr:LacI family DNA-binding transcriptional regulator [Symbiobacteriaceae bacterium]